MHALLLYVNLKEWCCFFTAVALCRNTAEFSLKVSL